MIYLRNHRTLVIHINRETRGKRSLCGLMQGSDGPMVDYRPFGYRVCRLCRLRAPKAERKASMTTNDLPQPKLRRERKGLMLCCILTAQRYNDNIYDSPKGTVITCEKCGQQIESLGGRAWKAK